MGKYKKDSLVFKAFCDESRLEILALLRSGEKCACVLQEDLNIVQSTISHHMKILCDAGIVNSRKEGKWAYYSINEEGTNYAKQLLNQITSKNDDYIETDCCDDRKIV